MTDSGSKSSSNLVFEQKSKFLMSKLSALYKKLHAIHADARAVDRDSSLFPAFRGKYKLLDGMYNDFINSWDSLYELYIQEEKEKDFPMEEKKRAQAESWVSECHSTFEGIMNPVPQPPSQTGNPVMLGTTMRDGSVVALTRSRLPKIQIPQFHGDPLRWQQFRDIFISLVHSEPALSAIEKFHHLVSSLTGEPLQIVSTFPLSDSNYDDAWEALNKRYNNKRILAVAYLHRIQQFKPPQRESGINHLRSFLKIVAESFSSLKALRIPDEGDYLKLALALECLDNETRKLFEDKQQGQEFPTYNSLIEFVRQRCQILELSSSSINDHPIRTQTSNNMVRRSKVLTTVDQGHFSGKSQTNDNKPIKQPCPKCKGDHLLCKCFAFNRLAPIQRADLVRRLKLCFNCLRSGHAVSDCSSKYLCNQCHRKHHSLLHDTSNQPYNLTKTVDTPTTLASNNRSDSKEPSPGIVGTAAGSRYVLLGTAIVQMRDWQGIFHPIRIVIDSGSQFSIITEDCAKRLGLSRTPTKHTVSGVGCLSKTSAKGTVHCTMRPVNGGDQEVQTHALVMPTITSNLPATTLESSVCAQFRSVELADKNFWVSRPIEFLLGSDLFLEILLSEPLFKVTNRFGTLPTIFGHVVIGIPPNIKASHAGTCLTLFDSPITDDILRSFWEIEEPLPLKIMHPDDAKCEMHFQQNVSRLPTGRYVVALPIRNLEQHFPTSKQLALKRFRNLEIRFDKEPKLNQYYSDFMTEYLDLHHMQLATSPSAYVIPHHAIFKSDLTQPDQPKIRVVFDASMKAPTCSLNDNLLIGPKLQRDITSIIINFRSHRIAFCTDIVKMYRQILIRSQDRRFQHILWRASQEDPIQTFELCTVTYGLASSPYLALRVLQQLVNDDGEQYPEASEVLKNDVYVDDIITGANSLDEAIKLKTEIVSLLQGGGFSVHKWASNSRQFLDTIQEATKLKVDLPSNDLVTKVLGMHWDADSDSFYYNLDLKPTVVTKRTILSVIARLFDPLGLVAPIIFLGKTIMQRLWLLKLGWDDQPPLDILTQWEEFLKELVLIDKINIPRWLHLNQSMPTIFGFCDASEKGYAAALYLRVVETNSTIRTFLLKGKTKLAPIKTICIPRLELCAAYLLTKLLRSIDDFCQINRIENCLLFTDSTVVLSWLRIVPSSMKTFVANRVGYILSHTQVSQWHHVPTSENPADVASRGTKTSQLINHDLWWNGPPWMREYPLTLSPLPTVLTNLPELKQTPITLINSESPEELHNTILHKSSNHRKVIRITAYIFRFIHRVSKTSSTKSAQVMPHAGPTNALTTAELQKATNYLVQKTQRQYFKDDFNFTSETCLSTRFKTLAVFLDRTGLLRVGGRLSHAQIPYDQRHPLLLPPQAQYTLNLIDSLHLQHFHLGLAALRSYLQRHYYIFNLRNVLRKRIWKCLRCFKSRAKPTNPFMADLPLSRVSQGRPFGKVGVDFAGPFCIKLNARRNAPLSKAYLCMFVCMAVKAVHLELVSALTTEAFLAAFDRFVSRRGLPTDIYSDCGLNFVGAARHLKDLFSWYRAKVTQKGITEHMSDSGINWHFNPPYTPHFGGLWEAAVKVAKAHLRKTVGDTPFLFEELNTLFTRIEAVMNSRPLVQTSAQPDSYDYLTPGHFLIGSALIAPPEQGVTELKVNTLSRWQLVQHAVQGFWKRWSKEYIYQLQARPKWKDHQAIPPKINDLVLIQDPHAPPLSWRMGKIIELHPGKDGVTRVVTVKTAHGSIKRAVHKLALLPHVGNPDL